MKGGPAASAETGVVRMKVYPREDDPGNIYASVYRDTTRPFSGVRHILLLFRGSVFKLIWHDVLIFTLAYYSLSLLYRLMLFPHSRARETFEIVCVYADRYSELIPISFLTGFYVTQVVWRWWDQFMSLPWPDRVAFKLVSYCPGKVTQQQTFDLTMELVHLHFF